MDQSSLTGGFKDLFKTSIVKVCPQCSEEDGASCAAAHLLVAGCLLAVGGALLAVYADLSPAHCLRQLRGRRRRPGSRAIL